MNIWRNLQRGNEVSKSTNLCAEIEIVEVGWSKYVRFLKKSEFRFLRIFCKKTQLTIRFLNLLKEFQEPFKTGSNLNNLL